MAWLISVTPLLISFHLKRLMIVRPSLNTPRLGSFFVAARTIHLALISLLWLFSRSCATGLSMTRSTPPPHTVSCQPDARKDSSGLLNSQAPDQLLNYLCRRTRTSSPLYIPHPTATTSVFHSKR